MAIPDIWDAMALNQLISNLQFSDLRSELDQTAEAGSEPTLSEIKLILLNPLEQCVGQLHDGRLHIFRGKQPFISLIPQLRWPKPRLKQKTR